MTGRARRLLALTAAALLVVGCGGGEPETGVGTTDVEGLPESGDTEAVARADADLVVWADEEDAAVLEPVVAEFAAELDVTAAVQAVPADDLEAAFVVANTEGTGPDVIAGEHAWIGTMVQNGAIEEIDLADVDRGRYSPQALAAATYNQTLYGLPYATRSLALYRNTDLAPDAPATVEALVETGSASGAETPLCLPVPSQGQAFALQPLYSSAGGYVFGVTEDGEPDPNDLGVGEPGSVAAATRFGELGAAGALTTGTTREVAVDDFAEGRCPYLVAGPGVAPLLRDAGVGYAVSPVPGFADAGPAQPYVEVQALFVASKGRSGDLARQLVLDGFNSPEAMTALQQTGTGVPAMLQVLEAAVAESPDVAAFSAAAAAGVVLPSIPQMASVWEPLGRAEVAVVDGADPERTMQDAGAAIARSLQ